MDHIAAWMLRLAIVVGFGASMATPVAAHGELEGRVAPVKAMLIKASDRALDKLARPGAFSADDAVRIVLPEEADHAAELVQMADKAGLLANLQRTINDAAGLAAAGAKPIFRAAIERMEVSDMVKILAKDDGATHYLRKAAGDQLRAELRPIIHDALVKTGAFGKLGKLHAASASLADATAPPDEASGGDKASGEDLTDSVADQAIKGIFKYIAHQEEKLREDPMILAPKLIEELDR
jgi:hypothetical protein